MIGFKMRGDFSNLEKYLKRSSKGIDLGILDKYGVEGVKALSAATPVDTGLTANSWYYKIKKLKSYRNTVALTFCNSNIQNGISIAIILQLGHATGTGGWVEGRDYINPALQPIFDQLAKDAWEEVTRYKV